jgi:hypothetical protein
MPLEKDIKNRVLSNKDDKDFATEILKRVVTSSVETTFGIENREYIKEINQFLNIDSIRDY